MKPIAERSPYVSGFRGPELNHLTPQPPWSHCEIPKDKSPNKVGYIGLLKPFSNGPKLFLKEQFFPKTSNFFIYYICTWN